MPTNLRAALKMLDEIPQAELRVFKAREIIREALASHEALSAEVAGLRLDAERLDFCQKRGFSIFQAWRTEKWRLEGQKMEYESLRAAIDAARQEKKDGNG